MFMNSLNKAVICLPTNIIYMYYWKSQLNFDEGNFCVC